MRVDVLFKKWITGADMMQRRKIVKYSLNIIEQKRLGKHKYIAGDTLSIADILCYEEIVQLEVWNILSQGDKLGFGGDGAQYLKKNYPNIYQWLLQMRKLSGHDKIHDIMIRPGILNLVRNRQKGFDKALQQYVSKL